MKFYITRNVIPPVQEQLIEDLSPEIGLGPAQEISFRAVEEPSFIQICGHSGESLPLVSAATVFLSRIAKRAADDVWDNKAKIGAALKDPAVILLQKVADALPRARKTTPGPPPEIIINLPVPDPYWGTGFRFTPEDTGDVAP